MRDVPGVRERVVEWARKFFPDIVIYVVELDPFKSASRVNRGVILMPHFQMLRINILFAFIAYFMQRSLIFFYLGCNIFIFIMIYFTMMFQVLLALDIFCRPLL